MNYSNRSKRENSQVVLHFVFAKIFFGKLSSAMLLQRNTNNLNIQTANTYSTQTTHSKQTQHTNVTCDFRSEAENANHGNASRVRGERGCRGVAHAPYGLHCGADSEGSGKHMGQGID